MRAMPAETSRNRTRTLLVVAGEFPPLKTIGRIRTVKFVEHLRAHGWQCIVVTLAPTGLEPNYDASLLAEIAEGVEVIRLPLVDLEAKIARFAKRLLGRGDSAGSGTTYGPSAAGEGAGTKEALNKSVHPELVEGQSIEKQGLRQAQPERSGINQRLAEAPQAGGGLLDHAHGVVRWVLRNFVDIPDSYAPWARAATRECLRLCAERRIDAIYTTLPPFSSIFVGHALRRKTGLPWIVDYRDLWYGDVLREWLPDWRKRLELRIEKKLLRAADLVVTVSEPKTAYMQRLHPQVKARWETLTNGYDIELYDTRGRTRPFGKGRRQFVYTGRLFKNRRGYAFAEALGRIYQSDAALAEQVSVRILGGVDREIQARYDEILARYGIAHLYDFAGDVGYAEAMDAQVNCDYLLLIVDTGETSDGVIPGKLFEYVAARRPIFALCDPGATQQIIERAKLGRAVPAESVEACETMLREWLAQPVSEKVESDDAYLAQFDRRAITARFAGLLDELVASHVNGGRRR